GTLDMGGQDARMLSLKSTNACLLGSPWLISMGMPLPCSQFRVAPQTPSSSPSSCSILPSGWSQALVYSRTEPPSSPSTLMFHSAMALLVKQVKVAFTPLG